MSKCERKVVRKFALETEKLMHCLCPTDKANKITLSKQRALYTKPEGEPPPPMIDVGETKSGIRLYMCSRIRNRTRDLTTPVVVTSRVQGEWKESSTPVGWAVIPGRLVGVDFPAWQVLVHVPARPPPTDLPDTLLTYLPRRHFYRPTSSRKLVVGL